ncbi:MAG: ATP-grasp domain-containing protein [Flavobacteriales bacterium]|nr:ATP-grasp domain-containing protein [Flavobacteriales bacterium]
MRKRQVKRALVLGGGQDQVPLFSLLEAHGVEAMLLDYLEDPPARALAARHFQESTLDREAVLRVAREAEVDLLISAGNDLVVTTLASVSEELGLYHNISLDTAIKATDKHRMKACFQQAGIPMPQGVELNTLDQARQRAIELGYPLVAKPVKGTSSKGVVRIPDAFALDHAWSQLRSAVPEGPVVLEQFISGAEVSVDAFVLEGQVHVLGITQLNQVPGLPQGFSFLSTLMPAPLPDAARDRVLSIAAALAPAFGITNGPFFFQAMVQGDAVYVLEMGARTAGGAKYRFIQAATGFDLLAAYVDLLLGSPVVVPPIEPRGFNAMTHVYAHPGTMAELIGTEEALVAGHVRYFLPPKPVGSGVGQGLAARDRVLSFMAQGETMSALQQHIEAALATLHVLDPMGRDLIRRDLYPPATKPDDRP